MEQRDSSPSPILRVTVGVPVYTADDQKIGKVGEVRGHYFKIETGLFRPNYWLNEDTVKEAVPEQSVLLAVDKRQVGERRVTGQPPAA